MTARLPTVGGDSDAWGTILNSFLEVSVNTDGTLATAAVETALSGSSSIVSTASGSPALGKTVVATSPTTYIWSRHPVDWINVVNEYSADPTGVTDATSAITSALGAAVAGQVVYLPEGTYLVSSPIVIPAGVLLRGSLPVSPGSDDGASDVNGSVLKASSGWTHGAISSSNNPGVVYINGNGTTINRPGVESLWVDLRLAPTGTHGISAWGGVAHASLRYFGVMGQASGASSSGTGNLVVTNSDGSGNHWADGVIEYAALQNAVGYGVAFQGQNTQFSNVHAQAYASSTGSLSGFYIHSSMNCRFTQCRSEQSGDSGFLIDCNPGTTPNSPSGSIVLTSCGTEGNQNYGMKVINSSTGGNSQVRVPVTAIGCSFDFDGAQGGVNPTSGAGVYVQGINVVTLLGCNVTTGGKTGSGNSHLYPEYGLITATPGSPQKVFARGGIWNCNSGPVLDGSVSSPIVEVLSVVGSAWAAGSTITLYTANLPGGGGGFSDPETTAGDMIYRNGSNVTSRLAIGSANQVLTSVGGVPTWANAASGFADPETTAGDMIFRNASNVTARLPIGLTNQIMTVVGGVPAWATAPTATIVLPTGDTTGTNDTKAIMNAINALPNGGVVTLGPGNFYVKFVSGYSNSVAGYTGLTGVAICLPAQTTTGNAGGNPVSLQGSGPATVINVVGANIGIYHHRSSSYGAQFSNPADPAAGFIHDLVIDGSNTTSSGAVGLDVGDARGIHVQGVTCQNFDNTGQRGCQIVNRLAWTEKCWFQIEFYNNATACYITTFVPGSDHSNEYNDYNFTLFSNQNQQGIVVDGTNQGGCNLWLKGNMCQTTATSGAPTGNVAALSIINAAGVSASDGHRWYFGSIHMKVEYNNTPQFPTGSVPPYGIYSDGVGVIQNCVGLISHSLTGSNLNGAEFSFSGAIAGDINLAQLSPTSGGGTSSSSPSFPGFGTIMKNTGPDQLVAITGGGTTGISINGQATNLTSGVFPVKAGGTITVNGSGSNPTHYNWIGASQMTY